MHARKHPTLDGEISRESVNTVSFAFAEPVIDVSAETLPLSPEKKDAPISKPDAIARVSADRPIGAKSRGKAARRMALRLVGSNEYQASLRERLLAGTLSPAVEVALLAYAYGKPLSRHEIDQTTRSLQVVINRPW